VDTIRPTRRLRRGRAVSPTKVSPASVGAPGVPKLGCATNEATANSAASSLIIATPVGSRRDARGLWAADRLRPHYQQPIFNRYASDRRNAERLATTPFQLPIHRAMSETALQWVAEQLTTLTTRSHTP
jgi:dTDP-4-amino-4,6-dideoxygalactose transaminase